MNDDQNFNEFRGVDYYLTRARIERAKSTRRFFRRLIGSADKPDTKSWG